MFWELLGKDASLHREFAGTTSSLFQDVVDEASDQKAGDISKTPWRVERKEKEEPDV